MADEQWPFLPKNFHPKTRMKKKLNRNTIPLQKIYLRFTTATTKTNTHDDVDDADDDVRADIWGQQRININKLNEWADVWTENWTGLPGLVG